MVKPRPRQCRYGRGRPTLVIMVKEPRAGRVKTRLGRDIGMARAAWWFRHRVRSLVRRLDDRRWDLVLAVAPDKAVASPALPPAARVAQGVGSLGDRMARVFRRVGPGPVLIVGADIPGITRTHIAQAFAALGPHDAVIGPAQDGGYWAIGYRHADRVPRGAFEGVRWSTPHAMADTIASIGTTRLARLPVLSDVDTVEDLAFLSKP